MENAPDTLPLKGSFLIAMPALGDPNFSQTVVCICEFSANGALGFIVNRLYTAVSAADIFQELNIDYTPQTASLPIYNGGPVNIGDVFVLHGPPFQWDGCLIINSWLALSNTRDILEAIALGNGPSSFLILLGCSGWGDGQLDNELKENFWLTCPANQRILFEISEAHRWTEAMKLMNIDPAFFSGTPGRA